MFYEVTSNTLGTAAEITAIMPIKQGLVGRLSTTSYASRLRALLYTYRGLRKAAYESRQIRALAGATEVLETLAAVRWTIIDNDQNLLLTVDFDSSWEIYIRRIVDVAGPVLDSILCHCKGYNGHHSTDLGYDGFSRWVRIHQDECEFFYSGLSDLTVTDISYMRNLQQLHHDGELLDLPAGTVTAPTPREAARAAAQADPQARTAQGLSAWAAFERLEEMFRESPDVEDGQFLWRAANRVLADFNLDCAREKYQDRYARVFAWHDSMRTRDPIARQAPAFPAQQPKLDHADIQGNILTDYHRMTHGCVVFLRFDRDASADAVSAFLRQIAPTTDAEAQGHDGDSEPVTCKNIAFTYEGLRRLGLSSDELARFPHEFREGMAARAGVLGDVRNNHPERWDLPRRFAGYCEQGNVIEGNPIRLSSVDAIVTLQTRMDGGAEHYKWSARHALRPAVDELAGHDGVDVLAVQPLYREPLEDGTSVGHFGMTDGISQPRTQADAHPRHRVPLGEVLLGQPNYAGRERAVNDDRLLHNGTFMVMRKLAQDVEAFSTFVESVNRQSDLEEDLIKAKMFGRWPDGKPLAHQCGKTADRNDFDYEQDENGTQCPLRSHVRRANPREPDPETGAPVPRIVRRGFTYGPPREQSESDEERGLLFIALNASIADQFEVITRWCSGGNSTSLFSGNDDPILGVAQAGQPRTLNLTDPANGKSHRFDMNLGTERNQAVQFVYLRWGLYLFVPSLAALSTIASIAARPIADDRKRLETDLPKSTVGEDKLANLAKYGAAAVAKLEGAQFLYRFPKEIAVERWKVALEDPSARGAGVAEGIWATVDAHHAGVMRTPYGVLVANPEHVKRVLEDDAVFSAREYWRRLDKAGAGEGFIGMDRHPQRTESKEPDQLALDRDYHVAVHPGRHAEEATEFNRALHFNVEAAQAFADARDLASAHIGRVLEQQHVNEYIELSLEKLAHTVLGALSHRWFGLPAVGEGAAARDGIKRFRALAAYVFNPHPLPAYVEGRARDGATQLKEQAVAYVDRSIANFVANGSEPEGDVTGPALAAALSRAGADVDEVDKVREYFPRTLVGSAQGFAGPTTATFLSTMDTLIRSEELWRMQVSWDIIRGAEREAPNYAAAEQSLAPLFFSAMKHRPVPEIIFRRAVKSTVLGDTPVEAGDIVVASLKRASVEGDHMLFGGEYTAGDAPPHACPGRPLAMGTALGMLCAVLEFGSLEPSRAPLYIRLLEASRAPRLFKSARSD